MRESPSVEIMELLEGKGAALEYSDPHVLSFPKMREHKFDLDSVTLTANTLNSFDAVVLATDHDAFDYELIGKHSKLLIDTRGKFRQSQPNVIKA